jgi:catechol 2,3-dioxygenase-like lactoylglutathione lyase family enzyme
MTLTAGFNHLAVLTADLDRFLAFYGQVFDATVIADIEEGGLRHAVLDVGNAAALHAFEQPANPDAVGGRPLFGRGHLDHFGVNVADAETFEAVRERLVDAGASDGTITDFGVLRSVSFVDPDGCDSEVALWQDGEVLRFDDRIQIAYPQS